jgi:hypothetical protein
MKTPDEKSHGPLMDDQETKVGDRLPWHRPEIRRLHVALDTSGGVGSVSDSQAFEDHGPIPP